MLNIFRTRNGMNIVGQGAKIILFVLPSLIAAILVHTYLPQIAALPESSSFLKPVGYLLLLPGLLLWGAAVIQLVMGFSKGRLVTTGAYGVVRNPIYCSATFFILPAVALMTLTWVYFVASIFLYVGVMIFIGKEEKQLTKVFRKEYEDYTARVHRLVPLRGLSSTGRHELNTVRRLLLICGVLASLLYVGSDIVAAVRWEGYSYVNQSVSELRGIGAPTRPFLVPLLTIYTVLEIAFGLGVLGAGRKRALRVTGALLIGLGIVDLAAPFFPMHLRGTEGTLTDAMHVIFTIVTVLLILLIIGFGAAALGKWFRLYSIVSLLILIFTGVWTFSDAPRIAANLPTPWVGVKERINIYGYMLWVALLAVALLRVRRERPETASA